MRIYCIAIIKNRYDKIEAFRFLDIDTLKENIINGTKLNTIDVPYNNTVNTPHKLAKINSKLRICEQRS